jgi:hypothetical protein
VTAAVILADALMVIDAVESTHGLPDRVLIPAPG